MLPLLSQRRRAALIALAAGATALLGASSAHAATFTVTSTADAVHGSCTASTCSLRDAVIAANATDADDTIVLGAGTYQLTLTGTGEDASATGDLDVLDRNVGGPLVLRGASARTTRIDASGLGDRAIDLLDDGNMTVEHLTVSGGEASDKEGGGGISSGPGALLTAADVTVSGNRAKATGGYGGGGGIVTQGAADLRRVTLSGNVAAGDGGGLYQGAGTLVLRDSTIVGNRVDTTLAEDPTYGAFGGGAELDGQQSTLRSVTITGNSIADPDGDDGESSGLQAYADDRDFTDVLVAGNTASAGITTGTPTQATQCGRYFVDATMGTARNLDSDGSCFRGTAAIKATPKLGPLTDNGGETDTVALLAGSPGIDQGTAAGASATDQRGVARQGLPDIGAFEFRAESDLGVTASAPATAETNAPVKQTFVVKALSSTTGSIDDVRFRAQVPAGAMLDAISSTTGSCVASTARCEIGSLPVGASATVTLTLTRTTPGSLATTGGVTGGTLDTNAANDTATATTQVTVPQPPPTQTTTTTTTTTTATTPVVPPPGVPTGQPPVVPGTPPTAAAPAKQRPRLTLSTTPSRDRSAPFRFRASGRLTLPAGVAPTRATCSGKVALTVKAGKRTLLTKSVSVRATCRYAATLAVTVPAKLRTKGRKLTVRARFAGNDALLARSASTKTVRIR